MLLLSFAFLTLHPRTLRTSFLWASCGRCDSKMVLAATSCRSKVSCGRLPRPPLLFRLLSLLRPPFTRQNPFSLGATRIFTWGVYVGEKPVTLVSRPVHTSTNNSGVFFSCGTSRFGGFVASLFFFFPPNPSRPLIRMLLREFPAVCAFGGHDTHVPPTAPTRE